MTHTFEIDQPLSQPADDVLAAMTDPEQWRRVEPESAVQATREASGTIRLDAQSPLPLDAVPAAARSALPASPRLVQAYSLSPAPTGFEGELTANVPGAPVDITASLTVSQAATGSRLRAQVSITCDVPLFGSMVERAAEPQVRHAIGQRLESLSGR